MWYPSTELKNSEMAELAQKYYGDVEIAHEDFLDWQYYQNPHGKVIGNVARESSGNVIAQYVLTPKFAWYNGQMLKGSHIPNTLTLPEYAGKGIFTSLAKKTLHESAEQGILFTYVTPNPNASYGYRKKLDFTLLGNLEFFVKPIDLFSAFRSKIKSEKTIQMLGNVFSPVKFIFKARIKTNSDIKIKEADSFSVEYEKFWIKYKDRHVVIGDRSPELMHWRYFQYPKRGYRVFMAYKSEQVVACIVIRMLLIQGIKAGFIVDFMTERSSVGQNGGQLLLRKVEEVFLEEKTAIAGCLIKNNVDEAYILKTMGYKRCPQRLLPQPVPISIKIHKEEYQQDLEALLNWDNWFFTMGDYDVG
jgi:hypothetical protein